MKNLLFSLFCVAALGNLAAAQSQSVTSQPKSPPVSSQTIPADDNDVVKINTTLVTIPVSVLDSNGRFIPGLRKEDFQIFEDGQAQQVELFGATEQSFT